MNSDCKLHAKYVSMNILNIKSCSIAAYIIEETLRDRIYRGSQAGNTTTIRPRDWRLSASWGHLRNPLKSFKHHSIIVSQWFKGSPQLGPHFAVRRCLSNADLFLCSPASIHIHTNVDDTRRASRRKGAMLFGGT